MPRPSAIALLVCLGLALPAAAGDIFYKRDDDGVMHFTNVPERTSEPGEFKLFAVFRGKAEASRGEIERLAAKYGRVHGMDERLIRAVIEVESGYQRQAVSSAGAEGLMQIMPDTQRELGVTDSFDPEQNIEAGVRYLRMMYDRFGELNLALAAYNAGPHQVERYGGVPPFKETQDYVVKVVERYLRYLERMP